MPQSLEQRFPFHMSSQEILDVLMQEYPRDRRENYRGTEYLNGYDTRWIFRGEDGEMEYDITVYSDFGSE